MTIMPITLQYSEYANGTNFGWQIISTGITSFYRHTVTNSISTMWVKETVDLAKLVLDMRRIDEAVFEITEIELGFLQNGIVPQRVNSLISAHRKSKR